MNEQFDELLYKSGLTADGCWNQLDAYDKQAIMTFAKLIVEECMEQVRGQFLPVLEDKLMMQDTHWDGYVQCGVDSYVAIREHFFGEEE
jgi:hypothetical protein